MPHHAVFKKSATTPLRIVFNASSRPKEGETLNDCLMTGPSLTAKLHEILIQFRQGTYAAGYNFRFLMYKTGTARMARQGTEGKDIHKKVVFQVRSPL